jgi:NAD(P)-dependent dehydrogenase (short-subunit alcohol dehydrogenase family)
MTKSIIIAGYGPGISQAVARRFGAAGFSVALVGRTAARVQEGAGELRERGIEAQGFVCDLSDAQATRTLLGEVSRALGPIVVLHWNAYSASALVAPVEELSAALDLPLVSLVAAVQQTLPELKQSGGAVLVTGGGLSAYDEAVDKLAVQWNVMGLSIAKAAQHKLVGLLHQKLAPDGVYVGEVTVHGVVKGSAFDQGHGNLDASTIADAFWQLFTERTAIYTRVS